MTDEQIRVAIAEACGWTYQKRETYPKCRPKQYEYILQAPNDKIKVLPEFTVANVNPEKERIHGMGRLPDYLNDLNAMHEAEKKFKTADGKCGHRFGKYHVNLRACVDPPYHHVINATARQRAQAFIATIGRKEGV